jgi:hypothetical protein
MYRRDAAITQMAQVSCGEPAARTHDAAEALAQLSMAQLGEIVGATLAVLTDAPLQRRAAGSTAIFGLGLTCRRCAGLANSWWHRMVLFYSPHQTTAKILTFTVAIAKSPCKFCKLRRSALLKHLYLLEVFLLLNFLSCFVLPL